eukprot:scaffold7377_cov91-Isochrysis_galbana.AAC.1
MASHAHMRNERAKKRATELTGSAERCSREAATLARPPDSFALGAAPLTAIPSSSMGKPR